jgi:hypothetical protein
MTAYKSMLAATDQVAEFTGANRIGIDILVAGRHEAESEITVTVHLIRLDRFQRPRSRSAGCDPRLPGLSEGAPHRPLAHSCGFLPLKLSDRPPQARGAVLARVRHSKPFYNAATSRAWPDIRAAAN